ncbi:YcaO-like family protein [Marinivivus vitaminiproducens]|uniref:YcaO-like family protein n=1 Tax=Marinivivus vitaminiproducens TaxID=3035935 RepID=UPI00279C1AD7|nr:YcaO-like family protein [Geminicoccaceae bacterium SCSIO 64248]
MTAETGWRLRSPSATLALIRPHLESFGITRIANLTGLDRIGIPTVMVCRPNSRSVAVSLGKGLDLDAALASGVMEAIEVAHAETMTLPLKLNSYHELAGRHRLADPERLPRLEGAGWDPGRRMLWLEGQDLVADRPVWLPHELVSADYTLPLPPGSLVFAANTNGLASGNDMAEAQLHGLFEVIERDAVTLWRLEGSAGRERTRLDLATVDDPACRGLLERFAAADVAVAVWDVTSDLGLPTYYAMIQDRAGGDPDFGGGCHTAPEVALARALTEAAQTRLASISGARDDFLPELYDRDRRERRERTARHWLREGAPALGFDRWPRVAQAPAAALLPPVLDRLAGQGLDQAIAVDLSRPDMPVAVARVVVPRLEGPSAGHGGAIVRGERARRKQAAAA